MNKYVKNMFHNSICNIRKWSKSNNLKYSLNLKNELLYLVLVCLDSSSNKNLRKILNNCSYNTTPMVPIHLWFRLQTYVPTINSNIKTEMLEAKFRAINKMANLLPQIIFKAKAIITRRMIARSNTPIL